MGQRFQIIISTPPVQYPTKTNPNNKPRQYWVLHNQWLYGIYAIHYAYRLIKNIEMSILSHKAFNERYGFKTIGADDILKNSIAHANASFFPHNSNTHRYFNDEGGAFYTDDSAAISKSKNWPSFVETLDNNNGTLFIWIDNKFTISYCFYNPEQAEEGPMCKCINAFEYALPYNEKLDEEDKGVLDNFLNYKMRTFKGWKYPKSKNEEVKI